MFQSFANPTVPSGSLPARYRGGASGVAAQRSAGANSHRRADTGACSMESFSWVELGGRFAGGAVVLAAVGKGLAWLLNWQGARDERKAARMREWEDSLIRREKDYREHIEKELSDMRTGFARLERNMQRVCTVGAQMAQSLRQHSPDDEVLRRWDTVLRAAVPLPEDDEELLELARQADRARMGDRP